MSDISEEQEERYFACYFTLQTSDEAVAAHYVKFKQKMNRDCDFDDIDCFHLDGRDYFGNVLCSRKDIETQLQFLRSAYTVERIVDDVPLPYPHFDPEDLEVYQLRMPQRTG